MKYNVAFLSIFNYKKYYFNSNNRNQLFGVFLAGKNDKVNIKIKPA
jgi:hypothetical protein